MSKPGLRVSAILLAAGFSRRMGTGTDKLLLPFRGKSLLAHAADLLGQLSCTERLLVSTPERLAALLLPPGVAAIPNRHPERGQSESLRLGVQNATGQSYLFLPADQPCLDVATVEWLLTHAAANPDKIVYPSLEGKPCNPVVFPARFRAQLLRQQGDVGGRAVRAAHPQDCVAIKAKHSLCFLDIDTPEDYQALLQLVKSGS